MQQANAEVEAQTAALQQANSTVQQLEAAIPKASLEAEAQQARARDLQQRLSSLETATQVTLHMAAIPPCTSFVSRDKSLLLCWSSCNPDCFSSRRRFWQQPLNKLEGSHASDSTASLQTSASQPRGYWLGLVTGDPTETPTNSV